MSYAIWEFNNKYFSERLRFIRAFRRMGLRAVAINTQISPSTLSRIAKYGDIPTLPNFLILCSWMGENPSDFYEVKE